MLCFLTPLAVIKDETIVNNQDSSLKVPLLDLKPSECLLDAKTSLVRIHQLIVPSPYWLLQQKSEHAKPQRYIP